MMTPLEHYKKAEELLDSVENARDSSALTILSMAQVHATLATYNAPVQIVSTSEDEDDRP
jgi:vacuolar-type H+-ATPase subunit E/Vma4